MKYAITINIISDDSSDSRRSAEYENIDSFETPEECAKWVALHEGREFKSLETKNTNEMRVTLGNKL